MSGVVLSRSALSEIELPAYEGIAFDAVVVVSSDTLAGAARDALMASDAVGFDTESKPTFLKGEASSGPHLVQLATASHAYLFPIERFPCIPVLKEVLESPHVLKVGFGLGNDRSVLKARLDIAMVEVLDLGEVLRGPGHKGTVGAKVAVAHFFGKRLQKSKKIGTSNWAHPHLDRRQLMYAANDAHVALRIYRAWTHGLVEDEALSR